MHAIDKVYVINLDRRPDRWVAMERRIATWSPDLQAKVMRFSAYTGEMARNDGTVMHPSSQQFTPGEWGCAYTHYKVWCHAQRNGYRTIMIFEDDVVFLKGWERIVAGALRMLSGTHCLMLNHTGLPETKEAWVPIRDVGFTGGYVLFPEGLRWMLSTFNLSYLWAADAMTQHLQAQGKTYGYFPDVCLQENVDSDIQTMDKLAGVASGMNHAIQGYSDRYDWN